MLLFISVSFTIAALIAGEAGKEIVSSIFLAASGVIVAMYYKKP